MTRPTLHRESITVPASGLVVPKVAASWIGISVVCLEVWRRKGCGPRWVRISERAIRYRVSDLEQWERDLVADPETPDYMIERYWQPTSNHT